MKKAVRNIKELAKKLFKNPSNPREELILLRNVSALVFLVMGVYVLILEGVLR